MFRLYVDYVCVACCAYVCYVNVSSVCMCFMHVCVLHACCMCICMEGVCVWYVHVVGIKHADIQRKTSSHLGTCRQLSFQGWSTEAVEVRAR